MLSSSKISSDLITRSTHWLILILFVMSALGGLRISELENGAEKLDMIFMHKSVGVCMLVLTLFRIFWRIASPVPLKCKIKNTPMRRVIGLLLLLLLLAQPIIGILMTQAAGNPVAPFGFFELPILIHLNDATTTALLSIHDRLWIAIVALGFAYFAGSLKQRFIAKNSTVDRTPKS